MEVFETDFFDILTRYNGQMSYVKHNLEPLHVFFSCTMPSEQHRSAQAAHGAEPQPTAPVRSNMHSACAPQALATQSTSHSTLAGPCLCALATRPRVSRRGCQCSSPRR